MDSSKLRKLHPLESLGVTMARRGDIRIERLQDRLTPKVPFPHKHDFYQIVIIHSSEGSHEIDFHRHNVKPGQIFVIKPGQVHSWKLTPKTKGFIIEYTEESFSDEIHRKNRLAQHSRLLPDQAKIAKDCNTLSVPFLEMMEQEFLKRASNFEYCLQNYLALILLDQLRRNDLENKLSSEQDDLVIRFTDLVEEHFQQQHDLKFYADKLKASPKAVSGKIQKALGKPAKEVILQRCLLEAKRLLSYSNLSISEIGYTLGFDDPNYFSRFLKKNMKVSAVQFRKTTAPKKD